MNEHLRCSPKEIDRDKAREIFEKAIDLVHEVGLQLPKIEVGHINESLKMI